MDPRRDAMDDEQFLMDKKLVMPAIIPTCTSICPVMGNPKTLEQSTRIAPDWKIFLRSRKTICSWPENNITKLLILMGNNRTKLDRNIGDLWPEYDAKWGKSNKSLFPLGIFYSSQPENLLLIKSRIASFLLPGKEQCDWKTFRKCCYIQSNSKDQLRDRKVILL